MSAGAPAHLRPIRQFSLSQARANLDVISRFGRFPHRNPNSWTNIDARGNGLSEKGDFVHKQVPPAQSS